MRVISGKLKSRRLSVPRNFPSRPTTDFAKEGLFNILENKIDLEDIEVLDLCSGTGNIAFEFISREAKKVTCVDINVPCIKHISKTALEIGLKHQIETVKDDICNFLKRTDSVYNIIFADPPYDLDIHEQIVYLVYQKHMLSPEGILIIEHGKKTDLSHLPAFENVRNFGNVYFSFFRSTNIN